MATEIKIVGLRDIDTDGREGLKKTKPKAPVMPTECGPIYDVPLMKSLPLNVNDRMGLRQALPSRSDLEYAIKDGDNHRLCAGYEVAIAHLQHHMDRIESIQQHTDDVSQKAYRVLNDRTRIESDLPNTADKHHAVPGRTYHLLTSSGMIITMERMYWRIGNQGVLILHWADGAGYSSIYTWDSVYADLDNAKDAANGRYLDQGADQSDAPAGRSQYVNERLENLIQTIEQYAHAMDGMGGGPQRVVEAARAFTESL